MNISLDVSKRMNQSKYNNIIDPSVLLFGPVIKVPSNPNVRVDTDFHLYLLYNHLKFTILV